MLYNFVIIISFITYVKRIIYRDKKKKLSWYLGNKGEVLGGSLKKEQPK